MTAQTSPKRIAYSLIFSLLPLAFPPAFAAQGTQGRDARMSEYGSALPTYRPAEYAYGAHSLQKLDFWHATQGESAPLIVFVHGGGWKRGDKKTATGMQKVEHFRSEGYAFATINYRLVPNATVEQQVADVSAAIAWLLDNAGRLGIDASRVVLMGHSAGAHLVALVGTDPQYMAATGHSLTSLRGVIALDGAAYDVPRQIEDNNHLMHDNYVETFGSDPVRQRALSPALQAGTPNAPAFLIAHIDRADGTAQSKELAAALVRGGSSATVLGLAGTGLRGHLEINRALGNANYPATAAIDTWLGNLLRPN